MFFINFTEKFSSRIKYVNVLYYSVINPGGETNDVTNALRCSQRDQKLNRLLDPNWTLEYGKSTIFLSKFGNTIVRVLYDLSSILLPNLRIFEVGSIPNQKQLLF